MPEAACLLELKEVSKFYAELLVLRNVSLKVYASSVLLVVGPNGSGKSTLLKILSGLAKPSSGSLARNVGPEDCGFLGHHSFVYPKLTALENLAFWAGMRKLALGRDELMAALERVGLGKAAERQAGVFSRGMTQRLSLARAFISRPKLIFLDEPDTGLDTHSRMIMQREIAALKEEGGSVVWVTHDLSRDLPLADYIVKLDAGRQIYCGPADGFAEAAC